MNWWPFNRKPVTHKVIDKRQAKFVREQEIKDNKKELEEKVKPCEHDWISDKKSFYDHTGNWDTPHHFIPVDVDRKVLNLRNNIFHNPRSSISDLPFYIIKTPVFDGVCRLCDEIHLGYSRKEKEGKEVAVKLLKEIEDTKNKLTKYRLMMEKS